MTKLNYQLVEQTLGQALHHSFVQKLVEGQSVAYPRAVSFFGIDVLKPNFEDSVILALSDWKKEALELEQQESEQQNLAHEEASTVALTTGIEHASITEAVQQISFPEPQIQTVAPLYILRKRLLWFIKHRVANIYTLLGTTKEEVIALRKKKERSPEDDKRIQELLEKASEINQRLLKKLGLDTDEALIEKEKQRHIRKRFNIKESWVPL